MPLYCSQIINGKFQLLNTNLNIKYTYIMSEFIVIYI